MALGHDSHDGDHACPKGGTHEVGGRERFALAMIVLGASVVITEPLGPWVALQRSPPS